VVKNGEHYPRYVNVADCQVVALILRIAFSAKIRKRVELRMWIITRIVEKGAVYLMRIVKLNRISNTKDNLKQMYISGVMDLANDLKIHGYNLDLEKIRKAAGKRFERDYCKNSNERRKKA